MLEFYNINKQVEKWPDDKISEDTDLNCQYKKNFQTEKYDQIIPAISIILRSNSQKIT